MTICVDARALTEKMTGFGRYLGSTLDELLARDSVNQYILLSDRKICYDSGRFENCRKLEYRDSLLFPRSFYFVFRLPAYLKKKGIAPDVFWESQQLMPFRLPEKARKVLTVYDLTYKKYPGHTTFFNLLLSRLFYRASVRRADDLVCISENTERELRCFFPEETADKRIHMIYPGGLSPDAGEGGADESAVKKEVSDAAGGRFILFVGTVEPRKNIPLLLDAAPMLKGTAAVVICGKPGWESRDVLRRLKNTDNVVYLDYITETEKRYLIDRAFCCAVPSVYEGFGLPAVEAMQSGRIVVAADNSSLSEIVEMDELKFRTDDRRDFCEKVKRLASDQELRKAASDYCLRRGAQFSWKKCAMGYLDIFGARQPAYILTQKVGKRPRPE